IKKWFHFKNFDQDCLRTRLHPHYILPQVKLVMHSDSKIRKDHLFIVEVLSTLIFSSMTMVNRVRYSTYGL
ncbi:MAG TPA: hypothetical protein VJP58_10555, partial [Candidatus Nitrosocosmicus sp.]|nr:hypothetical protein [Candidatus Nitrosocosmicus sp.]